MDNPDLIKLAGPLSVKGGGLYFTGTVATPSQYPGATQFIDDFFIYNGYSPGVYAAQAYDATGICMKAIELAAKDIGGITPTRREVSKAIRDIKDYQGIAGPYIFDKMGDLIMAKYFVYKVVSPDPTQWDHNTIVATYEIKPLR